MSKPYIYLDDQINMDRVPLDVGHTEPAAHIRARLDDSFAASINASTDRRKLRPQIDVFMSTELRGSVDACCPCPYTRVVADWSISAGVVTRGIYAKARARFDGNEVLAYPDRTSHRMAGKSAKAISGGGCAAFSFIIDQGWTETAASEGSILSRVAVSATFTCEP